MYQDHPILGLLCDTSNNWHLYSALYTEHRALHDWYGSQRDNATMWQQLNQCQLRHSKTQNRTYRLGNKWLSNGSFAQFKLKQQQQQQYGIFQYCLILAFQSQKYKGDPRPWKLPRAKSSSVVGLTLGIFRFLSIIHAKTNAENASTIFVLCVALYTCSSTTLRHSRCRSYDPMKHCYLDHKKNPKTPQSESYTGIKMTLVLGSSLFFCGVFQ